MVWSKLSKEVILVELTVDDESNFSDHECKHLKKHATTESLYQDCLAKDGELGF